MSSISFDDGIKTFDINGDHRRVIKISVTDYAIIDRIQTAFARIREKTAALGDIEIDASGRALTDSETAIQTLTELDAYVKEQVNYIFNSNVSDAVFAGQSSLSTVGGQPLYEKFLAAVMPVIEEAIGAEAKASKKRIEKYQKSVSAYKKSVMR